MSKKEEMTFSWRTSNGIREGGSSRFNQNSREGIILMIYYDREEIVFEEEDYAQNVVNKFYHTNTNREKLSHCKQ